MTKTSPSWRREVCQGIIDGCVCTAPAAAATVSWVAHWHPYIVLPLALVAVVGMWTAVAVTLIRCSLLPAAGGRKR